MTERIQRRLHSLAGGKALTENKKTQGKLEIAFIGGAFSWLSFAVHSERVSFFLPTHTHTHTHAQTHTHTKAKRVFTGRTSEVVPWTICTTTGLGGLAASFADFV